MGFDLALTDVESAGVNVTLAAVAARGARAAFFESDLADAQGHQAFVARVVAWGGPISCLINNAGLPAAQRGDLLDITTEGYDRVLNVNLRGTFFLTQAIAQHMAATEANGPRSIVTISSVSAELASVERGEYCLSKAGLPMLTKLFALRLAPLGVAVFEVRPGVIRTPMTAGVARHYESRIAAGLVPRGRWGEPEDVARCVGALASGKLGFATGSVVCIDGGLSIPRL